MFTDYHREAQGKDLVVGPGDQSYFGQITAQDVIEWCRPLFETRGYYLRDSDGKIAFEGKMAWDTPWHHVKHAHGLDCHLWHQVLFEIIFTRMGQQKWVPGMCHECWKVVVRPPTLRGLLALLNVQEKLGHPSKCGIETRETVHGLYGGYFYNRSLQEGMDCYRMVRKAVDEDPVLGKDVRVILKRACTEFEMRCGPSDKWEMTPQQAHVEAVVNSVFVHDIVARKQPDWAISRVHTRWIQWAYAMGDPTVFEYTDGKPLYPPYQTYHHLVEDGHKQIMGPKGKKGGGRKSTKKKGTSKAVSNKASKRKT